MHSIKRHTLTTLDCSTLASRAQDTKTCQTRKKDCSIAWRLREVKRLFLSFYNWANDRKCFCTLPCSIFMPMCLEAVFFSQHFLLILLQEKKTQSVRLRIKYVTIAIISWKLQYVRIPVHTAFARAHTRALTD